MLRTVQANVGTLPEGPAAAKVAVRGRRPSGLKVEILEKDTRATAISFGHPIDVTRSHPDFAALSVARVWLGEHRIASGRLYQRLREIRGLNYGDYAYIEAFPAACSSSSRIRTECASSSFSRSGFGPSCPRTRTCRSGSRCMSCRSSSIEG